MKHHDILIVGSGVIGTTLANSLKSDDLSIGIIDSVASPKFSKRHLSINSNSLNFLKKLDLWHLIKPNAFPYETIKVWDQEGSGFIEFNSKDTERENLGHIVCEGDIQKFALSALDEKQISFYWENNLEEVKKESSEIICRTSEDIISCSILIGCDGISSSVRNLAKFKSRSWSYNQTAIVANFKSNQIDSTIKQTFTKVGPLALLPINKEELTMIWSIDDEYAFEFLQKGEEEFIQSIYSHFGEEIGDLSFSSVRQSFPLNHLSSKTFAKDGVFLLGDAAHQIHPLAGLGLNAGIGDVICLSELINAESGLDFDKIAKAYNRKRIPINLALAASMEAFKRGFENKNIWVRLLRNTAFKVANDIAPLKKRFMQLATEL